MTVVIFDFDGTIADSFDVVLNITNRLAPEFGYPITQPEDIPQLKGLSSREVMRRAGVPRFKLPFLLRRLRGELQREVSHLQPISGIRTALQDLKQQGCQLGIVTSNSESNVRAFLERQGLLDWFDFIGSGLTLFGKGRIIKNLLQLYDLDPAQVVYVGDETRDIEAARKVGISVISVAWGFNSGEVLAEQNPDFLIYRPEELASVVEQFSVRWS